MRNSWTYLSGMFQGETCPRDVPRGRDKNSVHIFGGQYTKNLGEQNTCKIRRDFGQLKSLTANISVTDRDIKKNRQSKWSTRTLTRWRKKMV